MSTYKFIFALSIKVIIFYINTCNFFFKKQHHPTASITPMSYIRADSYLFRESILRKDVNLARDEYVRFIDSWMNGELFSLTDVTSKGLPV